MQNKVDGVCSETSLVDRSVVVLFICAEGHRKNLFFTTYCNLRVSHY